MDRHLRPEELARIATGGLPDYARASAVRHLAECPRCFAVYSEFVRTRLDPSLEPNRGVEDEWVRLGLEVGAPAAPAAPVRPRRHAPELVTALAVLVTLGLGVVAFRIWVVDLLRVPRATRAAIAAVVRENSANLLFGADLLPEPNGLRGNAPQSPNPLVQELLRQVKDHPDDPNPAYWLIAAKLAAGELLVADLFLGDALRDFPDDPRFENLAAIAAYARDDPDGATAHLRRALRNDRTGVAKYNLIRVLNQRGDARAADSLFAELRREHPGSALLTLPTH